LAAAKQDGESLRFADRSLQSDRGILSAAVYLSDSDVSTSDSV